MSRALLLAAGAVIGGAVWYAVSRQQATAETPSVDSWLPDAQASPDTTESSSLVETIGSYVQIGFDSIMPFSIIITQQKNAEYVAALRAVEFKYSIPRDLLVRLAYQESRFRADIISGQTVSSAGAVGLMQIVPKWHPDVNPLDWRASADYAGKYLAQLFRQFGTWKEALAAYNWGPGNLSKYGLAAAPTETRNYYTQILADAGGGVYSA